MSQSIHDVTLDAGGVVVVVRQWHGQGSSDRLRCEALTPGQARGWAHQLLAAAEKIEAEILASKTRTRDSIRLQIVELERQAKELDTEIHQAISDPIPDLRVTEAYLEHVGENH